jgi:hypothetical protein
MKQHRADLVSLFFALVFLTVAGWWAITYLYDIRLNVPNFGWFAAGALILVGVLGIVASLRRDRTDVADEVDTLEPVREPALVSPITEETTPVWRIDLPEPADRTPPEPPTAPGDEVPRDDTSGGTATGESPR